MKRLTDMYTLEELKKGVRNPFYHDFCKDVTVGVTHEDYALFEGFAKEKGVKVEKIIQRAIASYADILREDEE